MYGMKIQGRAARIARVPLPNRPRVDCAACPDGPACDIHLAYY